MLGYEARTVSSRHPHLHNPPPIDLTPLTMRGVCNVIALHKNADYTYVYISAYLSNYLVSIIRHRSRDLPVPYFVTRISL